MVVKCNYLNKNNRYEIRHNPTIDSSHVYGLTVKYLLMIRKWQKYASGCSICGALVIMAMLAKWKPIHAQVESEILQLTNGGQFGGPFYRAMHFSAKRGIAIACRLSVRLSVCSSVCLYR